MRLSVIGTGYLGAVHAAGMAKLGHDVIGVDSDPAKISNLAAGRAPFFEPGFPDLLESMLNSGRLRFTTSLETAADFATAHFICVGTPQSKNSFAADTSQVQELTAALATLCPASDLIIGKSTVPVGTAEQLVRSMQRVSGADAPMLAWNPEFLREGFAVEDTLAPDRLVFGTTDTAAESILREIYRPLLERGTPLIVTDLASAELVKATANSFLATKISFINAVAEICEAAGADISTVADGIGLDERIGRRFLNAGVGFGGGCLGKDIRAFQARANELGATSMGNLLSNVDSINEGRRRQVVQIANEVAGGSVAGRRLCILGAAFKPNSDDVRDSPALDVSRRLQTAGADVVVHDPQAIVNARLAAPELSYEESEQSALDGADIVLILTEWDCYRTLDPMLAASLARGRVLIDGRNCVDRILWASAGWECHALGRPVQHAASGHLTLTANGATS